MCLLRHIIRPLAVLNPTLPIVLGTRSETAPAIGRSITNNRNHGIQFGPCFLTTSRGRSTPEQPAPESFPLPTCSSPFAGTSFEPFYRGYWHGVGARTCNSGTHRSREHFIASPATPEHLPMPTAPDAYPGTSTVWAQTHIGLLRLWLWSLRFLLIIVPV